MIFLDSDVLSYYFSGDTKIHDKIKETIKGFNTAGQALHPPLTAASAASREVLNPSFPHSLDHARASTVAISLRSSINTGEKIAFGNPPILRTVN